MNANTGNYTTHAGVVEKFNCGRGDGTVRTQDGRELTFTYRSFPHWNYLPKSGDAVKFIELSHFPEMAFLTEVPE